MTVHVLPRYEELSKKAVEDLSDLLSSVDKPLVCVASGDSPFGLYNELVRKVKNKEVDISSWSFVGLDEWMGMNGNDEGSCRFHLNRQFFDALQIEKQKICFFDGRTNDPDKECAQTESFIQQHGGIDVAILGLGMNGHVGMNEPGTVADIRSHVAEIAPLTQQVGQKYFSETKSLSHGMTLGIQTLKEAKHIMLIVSGAAKAPIVKKIFEEKVSEHIPATFLRDHPGFTIYLDKAAAQFILHEKRNPGN